MVESARISAIDSPGAACVEKPVICVVLSCCTSAVVMLLICVAVSAPIWVELKAATSVVESFEMVVVDNPAICWFDSELMNDVMTGPVALVSLT